MADCAFYLEWISQSLDGQLSPEGEQGLKGHLAQCAQCRLLHQQFCEMHREFASWESVEPPEDLTGRVMAQIRKLDAPVKHPSLRRFHKFGGVAACALLLVGVWAAHSRSDLVPDNTAPQARQADVIAEYALTSSVENTAAVDFSTLTQEIRAFIKTDPGFLLLLDDIPEDLDGTWYTAADYEFLLVSCDAPEALFESLLPLSSHSHRTESGPLILVRWKK